MDIIGNRLDNVQFGDPIDLGEVVRGEVGQTAAIGMDKNGDMELYFVVNGSPATFYAANLITHDVLFEFNIPNSDAVWAMTTAPNGDIYFAGTGDAGHLYRYLPNKKMVECVGVNPADTWVWDLASTMDGCIYGATYPRAMVFEYNPHGTQFRNYGSAKGSQHYARSIAATEEYIYVGIGSTVSLQRINRISGKIEDLAVEGFSGTQGFIDRIWTSGHLLFLSMSDSQMLVYDPEKQSSLFSFHTDNFVSPVSPLDGNYYFVATGILYSYDIENNEITKHTDLPHMEDRPKMKCMKWVALKDESNQPRTVLAIVNSNANVIIYDPRTNEVEVNPFKLPTKPLCIHSLESDGQGNLYIGGYQRSLSIYNTETNQVEVSIPKFPQIEGIGFLNGQAYFGTYTKARIFRYNPESPLDSSLSEAANPSFMRYIGEQQDRPFSLTSGDGKLFIGSAGDYGVLSGALSVYDEGKEEWDVYNDIIPNQSIIGLAYSDGMLYGGSSVWGGLGIVPSEPEAKMFVWDVKKKEVVSIFTLDIPDIDSPPRMIGELSFGPDGSLWGAVDGTIFAMNPQTLEVVKSRTILPSKYANSKLRPFFLRWSSDGLLFTTLARKIIVINPDTLEHKVLDKQPMALMTLGIDGHLYYGDGSNLMMRKRI